MRGDGLRLWATGAWAGLAAWIVLGIAVLPKTQAWVDSTVGLQGTGLGPKFTRMARPADTALARKELTDGLAAAGYARLPRGFPRCWEQGLRLAASERRRHWSPIQPPCRRSRGIHRVISVRSRRVTRSRSHALAAQERARLAVHSGEVREVALKLFEEIRGANYQQFLRGEPDDGGAESRAAPAADRRRPRAGRVSSRTFNGCPIRSIWVGEARVDDENRPCVPYRLELSDGSVLAGDLAFEYTDLGRGGCWYPVAGLDWLLEDGASQPGTGNAAVARARWRVLHFLRERRCTEPGAGERAPRPSHRSRR